MRSFNKKTIGRKNDLIFYSILLIWPILQFCVFYIYVNFNSFLLAFKNIRLVDGEYIVKPSVKAFQDLWELLSTEQMKNTALLSVLTWALNMVTMIPLGLLFSFYIAKKHAGASFFRIMLFLPSILSSVVMVTIYRYFINNALPKMLEDFFGMENVAPFLSRPPEVKYLMIFIYNMLVGFGVSVLMYANAMSAIPPEITEAAMLDGATGIKEFFYVSLPMVFSTLSVFIVTGVAGIFTNQFNLFSFFAGESPFATFGYYLYKETVKWQDDMSHYPLLSALGLAMTLVAVPLTYAVKGALEKFGPKED